jgi:autotransporter-associated beta strand protein
VIDDGTNSYGLAKAGDGTLYLKGVNTFGSNSAVTLSGGTLKVDAESGLGDATNDVIFAGDAVLQVTGGFATSTGKTFTVGSGVTGAIQVDSDTLTIAGTVVANTSSSVLAKTGSGTLKLTGSNTGLDGIVRLDAGVLSIGGSSNALGDTSNRATLVFNGGNLSIDGDTALAFNNNVQLDADATLTLNRATSGAGVSHTMSGGVFTVSAEPPEPLPWSQDPRSPPVTAGLSFGSVTLNSDVTFQVTDPTGGSTLLTLGAVTGNGYGVTVTGSGDIRSSSVWSGTGTSVTLDSNFTGTLYLTANNPFTGGLTIKSGTLYNDSTGNLSFGTGLITLGDTAAQLEPCYALALVR